MMIKVNGKLGSQQGESIAEVLIALLISALGMLLLSSMIATSANLITRSKDTIGTYVELQNVLVEQPVSIPPEYADKISLKGGTVTFSVYSQLKDNGASSFNVFFYKFNEGNSPVIS